MTAVAERHLLVGVRLLRARPGARTAQHPDLSARRNQWPTPAWIVRALGSLRRCAPTQRGNEHSPHGQVHQWKGDLGGKGRTRVERKAERSKQASDGKSRPDNQA